MKTTVHIIPHSHWDREWYQPFEKHRMKLVELIDHIAELFETDKDYTSFHLDGQTIALDDYLEIKPEEKEHICKLVRDNKFAVGPWYILQDEFLTSGEACVRNLITGMKEAKIFGKICKIGYFPDAFGNAGQMPQILKQAGMKAIVFGRGVKPVGLNNETITGGAYESSFSEMKWQSPDGSELTGILFANWYNNGVEIPEDETEAKEYWNEKLAQAKKYAGTSQLLFMNGCDHQPVQKNLTKAIETARKLYPDIDFIQSDLESYVEAVEKEMTDQISTVCGELTSQETDGRFTLINTASGRMDLKKLNRKGETELERRAEPLSVIASLSGKKYPTELLRYSWKKLMQNHPHDSICSCNVDEVNDEVETRFHKSFQVAEEICKEQLQYLADQVDTSGLKGYPFVIYNTTGWKKTEKVSAVIDVERCYQNVQVKAYQKMNALALPEYVVKDESGSIVAAEVEDLGVTFGYDLPDDKFRQPYMARQVKVTMEAEKVPAMGYRTFTLQETEQKAEQEEAVTADKNEMENKFLRVKIHEDGSYTIVNKKTGKQYDHVGWYEDTGDIGNEYIYLQDTDKKVITTQGTKAEILLEKKTPVSVTYEIRQSILVPESAEEKLDVQAREYHDVYDRAAGRSSRMAELKITTQLTLDAKAKGLFVKTSMENSAKDHRIRVMYESDLKTETHFADSTFEIVERKNHHSSMWTNPSRCDRQQSFVAMKDAADGLLIANRGIYEYEILPDEKNTIALTLLRSVGEMGDWGYFPTPKAQMIGTWTAEYEIVPFEAAEYDEACVLGYQYQNPLLAAQTGIHAGTMKMADGFFAWEGSGFNLTGFKMAENGKDVMVRLVNNHSTSEVLKVKKQPWMKGIYRSNVIEETGECLEETENYDYEIDIRPYEIVTIGMNRYSE